MVTERYRDLEDFLARSGVSPRELARQMGVTPAAVSQWRRRRRVPRPPEARRLAEFTGVSLEVILGADPTLVAPVTTEPSAC